jgi:diketogulonate reductase-like aldo/keto reductase
LGSRGHKEEREPRILDDSVLKNISAAHTVAIANICISWALQRGTSVVAKGGSVERQKENLLLQIKPIEPPMSEMEEIARLERGYRLFLPQDWWGEMAMHVFDCGLVYL